MAVPESSGGARLDTSARTVVALAPDWRRPLDWLPALSAYVAFSEPEADTSLCLDAREPGLPLAAVRAMVGAAVERLMAQRPFAEVLLLEEPVDLEAAAGPPVESAGALVERLGLRVRELDDDASAIAAHARWAKAAVDAVQAILDRALYEAAPAPPADDDPLVTVRIPTYGSADLLVSRALPSVLAGGYQNLEVLVCSDGPQRHARAAVEGFTDPRVRFLELPARPLYADWPRAFWQTAGIDAINHALDEARGGWIAPLDHDDAFTYDHVDVLLDAARRSGADFVWGQGMMELIQGPWTVVGEPVLRYAGVVHGAVMYSSRLAHMRYDRDCWLIDEPGDWNMWRRIVETGARVAHLPHPVVMHFREGSSMAGDRRLARERTDADVAADVLSTSARALLGVASPEAGIGTAAMLEGTPRKPRGARPDQPRGAMPPPGARPRRSGRPRSR